VGAIDGALRGTRGKAVLIAHDRVEVVEKDGESPAQLPRAGAGLGGRNVGLAGDGITACSGVSGSVDARAGEVQKVVGSGGGGEGVGGRARGGRVGGGAEGRGRGAGGGGIGPRRCRLHRLPQHVNFNQLYLHRCLA